MKSTQEPDRSPSRPNSVVQQLWQQQTAQYLAPQPTAYMHGYAINVNINVNVYHGQPAIGAVYHHPGAHGRSGHGSYRPGANLLGRRQLQHDRYAGQEFGMQMHAGHYGQSYGHGLQQPRIISENAWVDEYGRMHYSREPLIRQDDHQSYPARIDYTQVRLGDSLSQHVNTNELRHGAYETGNLPVSVLDHEGGVKLSRQDKAISASVQETHTKTSRRRNQVSIPSSPPQPPKRMRIKTKLESSPCPPPRVAPVKANAWANFSTHIKNDDKQSRKKAHDEYQRLGGDELRLEIKETYKDQSEKRKTMVNEGGQRVMSVGRLHAE